MQGAIMTFGQGLYRGKMKAPQPSHLGLILVLVGGLAPFFASAQDYSQPKAWKSGSITGKPIAVRNGASKLYGTYVVNKSHCPRYLRVFDKKASDVKLGVDSPIKTIEIPPQNYLWVPESQEVELSKGLAVACTRKPEETDARGSFVNECFASLVYK